MKSGQPSRACANMAGNGIASQRQQGGDRRTDIREGDARLTAPPARRLRHVGLTAAAILGGAAGLIAAAATGLWIAFAVLGMLAST